jgi:hypothetical protein
MPTQIAVSLVTRMRKHRASCDPATTAFRSYLGTRIVLVLCFNRLDSNVIPFLFIDCLFCELVSVSDAHSYALHGLVMQFAHTSEQHRSRLCRICCAGSSTFASSELKPCSRSREQLH